jgi:hypothetical protein
MVAKEWRKPMMLQRLISFTFLTVCTAMSGQESSVPATLSTSAAPRQTTGAYGASRSVYSHFIARGQNVVFPQNTLMEIGIGSRGKTVLRP